MTLADRPEDAVITAISTTVVMVVAAVSPDHAWQQPVLRLADTVVGVVVGLVAAYITQTALTGRRQEAFARP